MDLLIPHTLGLDIVEQSDLFTKEALDSFEELFTWLEEILETAKGAFQSSCIQVLPKTPSAKRRRANKKRSELPSFISRSSICVGKTLHFSETNTSTCSDENIPPGDESLGNTSHHYSTRSTRQKTSQITKPRRRPARGKSRRSSSSSTSSKVIASDIENSVSPSKKSLSLQKSSTDSNESKTENNPVPSCTNTVKISPNHNVASSAQCEKQTSPVDSEHRVDNSSYVIERENPSSDIPKIDDSPNCQDIPKNDDSPNCQAGPKIDDSKNCQDIPKIDDSKNCQDIPKIDDSKNCQDSPKVDDSKNCQDSPKIDDSKNCQDTPKTDDSKDCQDTAPIKNIKESDPDYGVPSDDKTSSINSCNSEVSTQASSSSMEVPQASTHERPRTRTRRQQAAAAAALNNNDQTAAVSIPCTRSRARKRRSVEVEDVISTDTKRHCADKVKKRSNKESVASEEFDEDADVEDSEDESKTNINTLINVYTASSSLCTPKQNGIHSFLLNSSYSMASRSLNRNNGSLSKYVRTGALTSSAQKNNTHSRLQMLKSFGNFKSFLKKTTTPIKSVTSQEIIELRKRELESKQRKETERMMKRDELQRLKLGEHKKKREERMRKAAEARQTREIQELNQKNKKTKILEEKFTLTDRVREEKLREEKEKMRMRLKKQQEVEERRKIEEKERNRKRKEQEEQQMRHQSMLQRKKEFEEQERLKKAAEEKRKIEEQKERKLEAEREKRQRFEEEREQERLRFKAEREKEVARQRAERERYLKEKQKTQESCLEKIREMERERLLYEQSLKEKKLEKDERIQKLLAPETTSQTVAIHNTTITIENPTSCSKSETKSDSYEMTPHRRSSYNSYAIDDLKSDDSTDEDSNPQKPIPKWAQGPQLKIALFAQYYNPPNLDQIFLPIENPDLNEFFAKKKARFNHRSSSAQWDTPILRSHLPVLH